MARQAVWPRGGWARAATYFKHRLRRLPDSPERVGRGVAAGVLASFTPLFGLHFIFAGLFAKLMRGNILASLIGTFVGNPLTFPFIAFVSLELGHLILGQRVGEELHGTLWEAFSGAWSDLWFNLRAVFTDDVTRWRGLGTFWTDVFLPYAVGGVLPGIVCALAAYVVTVPIVAAYQRRRAGMAARRMAALRAKARDAQRNGVVG